MKIGKLTYKIIFVLFIAFVVFACEDDRSMSYSDHDPEFSAKSVIFDTIFTATGSTVKSFRIINRYDEPIYISSICLGKNNNSNFKLNVDGLSGDEIYDVEVPANDSLYVFVEATIDPNGSNQPMVVSDSITFMFNDKNAFIPIKAWGQDFVPVERDTITTCRWTADKPYLVYGHAYIDSGQVLTVDPGARIYFHRNATLYVKGSINALGTSDNPIVFASDKREKLYEDIPDQWWGIMIYPNSVASKFENVEIRNANTGLQIGTIEQSGSANVSLHNVVIENMSYAGIFALKSNVTATNTLISNCGYYCVATLIGGNYNFRHCTIANYWMNYPPRITPSLMVSNQLTVSTSDGGEKSYVGDITTSSWENSIVWGNVNSEIGLNNERSGEFHFNFDHCLLKLNDDSIQTFEEKYFRNVILNQSPNFVSAIDGNYELDSLSAAKNAGDFDIAEKVPFDLKNQLRLSDGMPDLGVFERKEKRSKSKVK